MQEMEVKKVIKRIIIEADTVGDINKGALGYDIFQGVQDSIEVCIKVGDEITNKYKSIKDFKERHVRTLKPNND